MNASRQIVKSGDIELAVYTWGRADAGHPAVLLVHGYPDSARVWEQVAGLLRQLKEEAKLEAHQRADFASMDLATGTKAVAIALETALREAP